MTPENWDHFTCLGVEVPVVNVLGVQVDHPTGDVRSQIHFLLPAQTDVFAGQKLFQASAVHVLQTEKGKQSERKALLGFLQRSMKIRD